MVPYYIYSLTCKKARAFAFHYIQRMFLVSFCIPGVRDLWQKKDTALCPSRALGQLGRRSGHHLFVLSPLLLRGLRHHLPGPPSPCPLPTSNPPRTGKQ